MKTITQGQNETCVPVALAQVCAYLELPVTRKQLVDDYRFTGGELGINELIKKYKIPLVSTPNVMDVINNGGILSISHPIYNLHKISYLDKHFYNSWMGPAKMVYSERILSFLPHPNNLGAYYIKN